MQPGPPDLRAMLEACASGDAQAREQFQQCYGALVYTFPVRVGRVPEDEAAAFYLYAFGYVSHDEQSCRICKRSRAYTGRNGVPFEAFLSHVVLPAVFLDWQREQERKRLDVVSLDTPSTRSGSPDEQAPTWGDLLPTEEPTPEEVRMRADLANVLQRMPEELRLLLQVLALGTVDWTHADIAALAQLAACSPTEMAQRLDTAQAALVAKESTVQAKWEKLPEIASTIAWYKRQLYRLEQQIAIQEAGTGAAQEPLLTEKAELERLVEWRYRQQVRLRQEIQHAAVRPSYREIAHLLNRTEKEVSTTIAHAREELRRRLRGHSSEG